MNDISEKEMLDLFFTNEEFHVNKNHREYFLRLNESWLRDDTVSWLEEQDDTQIYAYFYLKLCVAFLYRDGLIQRNVGTKKLPCSYAYIASVTHVSTETAYKGMELLEDVGLIQKLEDGRYYIPRVLELLGCETGAAQRMRKMRAKLKQKEE